MGMEALNSIMTSQVQAERQRVIPSKENEGHYSYEAAGTAVKVDNVTTAVAKTSTQEGNEQQGGSKEQDSSKQLKKAVETMNRKMQNAEAIFGVHDKTDRITIKIVDKDTKELIREVPPEKTLDMLAKAWELAGILVDEKR